MEQTLTAGDGTWSGTPGTFTYAYLWQRCETGSVAGADWTTQTAPASYGWRSVVWGGPAGAEKFVAVGGDATDSTADDVLTSPNGVDWTAQDIIPAAENNYWTSVTWGDPPGDTPGQFVAVSSDGTNRVMTSPDGVTWTARSAASSRSWKAVTWGGPAGQEKFVAVADNGGIMTSTTGISWASQSEPAVSGPTDWRAITWGGPAGQEKFVAVAYSSNQQVMTSPDGVNWTRRATPVERGWFGVTWGGPTGDEKFVAVAMARGSGKRVMTSPDGVNWTAQDSPRDEYWNSVAWGGPPGQEAFVAVSDTGAPNQVMTSPNGLDWKLSSSSSSEKWRAVAWGGPPGQATFVSVAYDQPPTSPAGNRVMTSQGGSCAGITDATNPAYTIQTADFGKYVRVRVTANNGVAPDGFAFSPTSSQVAGIPPSNTAPPSISGTAKVREVLTANPGSWSGDPAPSLSYEWQRCDTNSGSCTSINETNSLTYLVQPADVGKYMRVKVTGTNGASPNAVAYSPTPFSGPVLSTPPRTLYVNKYSPNQSSVPGCATAPYTEIGSAWPSPSGAVGDAASGDTIFICGSPNAAASPYTPAASLGTKSLSFVGEGPELTILDGQNDRTLFFAGGYDSGQSSSYLTLRSMT
ncbi:MAG: hypothetical protein FGM34_03435, partial [Solirubrobacteraceae bacterium]|nr:hypothetical protein [Solirubrobacteraceae bacterium]